MTTGIYKLKFADGSTYIGKSVDCERRFSEHQKKLSLGTHSQAMQRAYKQSGMPSCWILQEAHQDHIDLLETIWIYYHQPNLNTASTVKMSVQDAELLDKAGELLKLSTRQHIESIYQLTSQVASLKDQLALKGSTLEYLQLKQTNEELLEFNQELIEQKNSWRSKYQQEKSKTWWQRIFNQ